MQGYGLKRVLPAPGASVAPTIGEVGALFIHKYGARKIILNIFYKQLA